MRVADCSRRGERPDVGYHCGEDLLFATPWAGPAAVPHTEAGAVGSPDAPQVKPGAVSSTAPARPLSAPEAPSKDERNLRGLGVYLAPEDPDDKGCRSWRPLSFARTARCASSARS
jgi:hypothetical protein